MAEIEYGDVPFDLRLCMKFAKENHCQWINMDCDGEVIDELPKYEW